MNWVLAAASTAVDGAPAGGAATTDVVIGTVVSLAVTVALLVLGLRHRAGSPLLTDLGRPLVRRTGLPAWTVVPLATAVAGLAIAAVGFVWDVGLHVAQGRDTGPFGTPAHYLILGGLYLMLGAGWLAVAMPVGERRASWVRIMRGWYAPPAAIVMLVCAGFSITGFPLDDIWHTAFGQDVTLWGPTHLMMISGGLFEFFALVLLVREGREAARDGLNPALPPVPHWLTRMLGVRAASVVLTGFTIAYLQEFAYGVPQFRLLFDPTIIAFTAGLGLVAAAAAFGRGGAIKTALSGIITLGVLTVITGPILGEPVHHFPLFLAEALAVELAWRIPWANRGGYHLAVVAGALIGTVGVAAELAWSHVWMPIAWPVHVLPEAMLRSVPLAICGGLIGAFVAAGLAPEAGSIITRRRAWVVPAAALVVTVVSLGSLLPKTTTPLRATVTLTDVRGPADHRTAGLLVRVSRPDVVKGADWFYAMGWQGKEHRIAHSTLQRVGEGLYRTENRVPLYGTWKTVLRLHKGSIMQALPVYMPADSAIPVPAVAATPRFDRAFVSEVRVLQRERKPGIPGWLFSGASGLVALATLSLAVLLGWALLRQAAAPAGAATRAPEPARAPAPPSTPTVTA